MNKTKKMLNQASNALSSTIARHWQARCLTKLREERGTEKHKLSIHLLPDFKQIEQLSPTAAKAYHTGNHMYNLMMYASLIFILNTAFAPLLGEWSGMFFFFTVLTWTIIWFFTGEPK